ncbi:sensor histidine kinase [Domibacillus indicus]|uniref:cache domain-containing sensor histidine kinase n=1 Tax=Domibacillus indicus TaxID=1437523 RepID=UPI00203F9282|nr:sensor histidine kinase [Domibacillus indicus]MCM3790281.1 sensor histidine kinase [Domibacillus indicus]
MNKWDNLMKWVRPVKIRQKYFVTMLIISILPIAALGFISYNIAKNTLAENQLQATANQLKTSSESADLLLQNVINLERLMSWNQDLQSELKESAANNEIDSATMTNETLNRIDYIIYSYFIDTQDIDSVCLFDIHHRPYCYGNSNSIGLFDNGGSFPEIEGEKWYQEGLKAEGGITFFSRNVLVGNQSEQTFSSVKLLRDAEGVFEERDLGMLVVNVKKSLFERAINESGNSKTMVFDDSGSIVRSVYSDPIVSRSSLSHRSTLEGTIDSLKEDGNLVSSYQNDTTGWTFVHTIDEDELFSQSSGIRNATALLAILMVMVSLYLSFVASGRLTQPFLQLKLLTSDWSSHGIGSENKKNDEITEIGETFKRVTTENKELSEELVRAQLKEREAELKVLQAQIKPHFLYNTLDSMYWMATINNNPDIAKMALALSESFKISLSKGKEQISVKDELDHIRHYITIQNLRYQDRFTYIEDVDPAMLDRPMLKLLLQPLVENAIYHGLEQKVGPGTIRVTGWENDGLFKFTVEDDGVGMEDVSKANEGFGMSNVKERLLLFYGPESTFKVASEPGKGTKVELQFPEKKGEK